jgi:phage terminase large subunit GpA-like protein
MSRPIRYLFEDEIDTWPMDLGEEAPSIEIVEACTLSYAHIRKILRISTPTVPSGAVWVRFLRGSQHKYHVPCPLRGCKKSFELVFELLNFHRELCKDQKNGIWDEDKVEQLTSLTCPHCKRDIDQSEQCSMVDAGKWVQTNPHASKEHISWHISAMYSPNVSWGQLARFFLQKKDTPGGLHDFYNHYLGLPFIRKSSTVTITDVERVRDSSPEYTTYSGPNWVCPAEFKLILMSVDVQQDGFWWAQRGVTLDEASYLIDYGPAAAWEDLMVLFDRIYKLPSGEELRLYKALIDAGYIAKRISGVYDFCLRSGGKFIPCQGRSPVHGLYQPIRETQFEYKGILIDAVQLRDDMFKEELYIRRIQERAGTPWYLPRNLGEVYKKQLTNERLVGKKTATGTEVMEWIDDGNNHLGDVEKYLLAALNLVSPFLKAEREGAPEQPQGIPAAGEVRALGNLIEATNLSENSGIPRTPRESEERRRAAESLELA